MPRTLVLASLILGGCAHTQIPQALATSERCVYRADVSYIEQTVVGAGSWSSRFENRIDLRMLVEEVPDADGIVRTVRVAEASWSQGEDGATPQHRPDLEQGVEAASVSQRFDDRGRAIAPPVPSGPTPVSMLEAILEETWVALPVHPVRVGESWSATWSSARVPEVADRRTFTWKERSPRGPVVRVALESTMAPGADQVDDPLYTAFAAEGEGRAVLSGAHTLPASLELGWRKSGEVPVDEGGSWATGGSYSLSLATTDCMR